MDAEQHPDLFRDAAQAAARDLAQIGSLVAAAGRVVMQHRAHAEQARKGKATRARKAAQAQVSARTNRSPRPLVPGQRPAVAP